MAGRFDATMLGTESCGRDIVTLRLTRPAGYEFSAGQWFRLTLDTPDGPIAETFSHASAPADEYLELTTRLSASPFKRALAALDPGSAVSLVGPGGRLSLPPTERLAFLVGGVGITPIRSMLRDAAQSGRTFDDALLLYGNRDETCVPFRDEFLGMSDIGVRVVLCYEQPSPDWAGERGFITAETVRRHLHADDGRPYVVTGPPAMVSAMEAVLDELEVGNERRVVERFGSSA